MSRIFTFRFEPNGTSLSKRILRAAKSRKADVHPDEVVCTNFKDLLEIASEARLKLLQTVIEEKPESLYDLAQKLDKDQAYILREAKILEGLGLLELKSSPNTEGRKKLKPIALYDKVVIDCGLKGSLKTA